MNNEFTPQDDEQAEDYQYTATNRANAMALLNKLKSRETDMSSKIIWKDGQPTLIETTRSEFKTPGLNLSTGTPATDQLSDNTSFDRVPSLWEARLDARRRANYTLAETPTMAFKASGHLPAHYYMDESALEAYVESLTTQK